MLAEKLLVNQVTDPSRIKEIISFLCSESGSHDYTINRREAKNTLGLNVSKPDEALYSIIKAIYDDISIELGFRESFDPKAIIRGGGLYEVRRALVESTSGGCDSFISKGKMSLAVINTPNGQQQQISDERVFEGWQHE